MWKLSEFYTTELVNSHFHLCGRGYHHNCVDDDVLVIGTEELDDALVTLYSGYYDWSTSRQLYVTDSRVVHIL
jgi:hypothetical protein